MAAAVQKKPASAGLFRTQKLDAKPEVKKQTRSMAQRSGLYMRNADRPMDSGDNIWLERIVNENRIQDRYEDSVIQQQMLAAAQAEAEANSALGDNLGASRELPPPAGNPATPEQPETGEVTSRPLSAGRVRPLSASISNSQPYTNFTSRYSKAANGFQSAASEVRPNGELITSRFNEELPQQRPRSARPVQSQAFAEVPVAVQTYYRPLSARSAPLPPAVVDVTEPDSQSTELRTSNGLAQNERTPIGFALFDTHGAGVVVREVSRNTPAFRAGVRVGDTIHFVNKRYVRTLDQFEAALSTTSGPILELWVGRVGARRNLRLSLLR